LSERDSENEGDCLDVSSLDKFFIWFYLCEFIFTKFPYFELGKITIFSAICPILKNKFIALNLAYQ
jgi:hypothetical protein